ncbi:UDP-N-acetylmuramoyl-L-alanine--D-glutamate ligase [Euzebya tangerina]|uniref:UDP-N-acetylmuramoyl-L-alanine--D-glutamate ligase n=1 Tax=Euzebya tangerina TaxID=591198 RepID=UPI000E32199E|nr:UDP-N-acetylmuramoyl-L-alanine--D-glutamate ligase [Euzebya tangerina]
MRVLVVGMGASGRAMVDALLAAGETVVAVEEREDADVSGITVPVALGPLGEHLLDGIDVVATSPGVPPTKPVLAAAERRGIPVWSEPELAFRLNAGRTRLVGVTGTNGKTTTTQMIAACLDAPAAGNIGPTLVTALTVDPAPIVVAELSSFQLHYAHTLRPDVAVLLNVADDHLDWHGGADGYRADKARIWRNQRTQDIAVINADDPGAAKTAATHPPPGTVIQASATRDGMVDPEAMTAAGAHNVANATLAAHAAVALGVDRDQVRRRLHAFDVGDHRLQRVATIDGVAYVNDSKATNPHAALASLQSYDDIVWIAGGLNKGLSFDLLGPAIADQVRHVVTIGACGPEIAAAARRVGVAVTEAGRLDKAVPTAHRIAQGLDRRVTVLLAPAAASMDQFTDYAERGKTFAALVSDLQRATA